MVKNKNSAARYAFIGLIVAAIGCLATGLLALVQGTVALKLLTLQKPEAITQWIAVSAAVLVLGLAVYGILNPDGVRRFLTGRQARYGSNAIILAVAFVGLLFVVNLLVYQNPMSHDFTEDKQHTLAPETIRALATLPDKVTAIAFYSTQTSPTTAQQLLTDFKSNSKGKFDFRFVDPNADPVLARQYAVTGDGKVVLTMGKASETASFAGEQEITQAMIRLISPEARTVYFLSGHGEPDINASDNTGLSRAKQTLESKNYTVKTLGLATAAKIPEDAKALIEVGPTHPLLDQEVTLIKDYLTKGGALIVLEESPLFIDAPNDPLADYLKNSWGISSDNDVIVDSTSQQPLNAIAGPGTYNTSDIITQHLSSYAIMPESRSLTVSKTPPQGITPTVLITTTDRAYGETDIATLKDKQQAVFDPATDTQGPLNLAVSAENATTKGRVVVFGNAVFATDNGFDAYSNGDAFINSVDWAAQQGNLINITPHTPITRTFNPPGQVQFIIILLGSVIVIPGLIVAAGISNWLARRRRG